MESGKKGYQPTMSHGLSLERSRRKGFLAGAIFSIAALFIQPLVAANISNVYAAGLTPSAREVTLNQAKGFDQTVTFNATGHENLSVGFQFNATTLDANQNESFSYGYEIAGERTAIDTIPGAGGEDASESGQRIMELPDTLNDTSLVTLYFLAVSTDGQASDSVRVTLIAPTGDPIVANAPTSISDVKPSVGSTVSGIIASQQVSAIVVDSDGVRDVRADIYSETTGQQLAVNLSLEQTSGSTLYTNVETLDSTAVADGGYQVVVRVTDAKNKTTTYNANRDTHRIIVDNIEDRDTERPVAAIVSPAALAFNPSTVAVDATDNKGLRSVVANIHGPNGVVSGGNFRKALTGEAQYTLTGVVPASLADGIYTLRAGAVDTSNNNAITQSRSFTIDTTKPTLKLNEGRTSYLNSGDATSSAAKPEIEARDTNLDAIVVAKPNGDTVTSWTATAGSTTRRAQIGWLAAGTYHITATDKANNTSEVFVITIDNTAPTVTVKSNSIGTNGEYQTVSFKLHDMYKIDRVTINGVEKQLSDNAWSDVNDIVPGRYGAVEGENTLVAYDVAGNATTVEFVLDTTAPVVTNIAAEPTYFDSETVSVVATAEDTFGSGVARLEFVISGTTETGATKIVTCNKIPANAQAAISRDCAKQLPAGQYQATAYAYDIAGNKSDGKLVSFAVIPVPVNPPVDPVDPIDPVDPTDPTDETEDGEGETATPIGPVVVVPVDSLDAVEGEEPSGEADEVQTSVAAPFTYGAGVPFAIIGSNTADAAQDSDGEVAGVQTGENEQEVLAATTESEGCAKFLGLCWYWWIPITIAIVGAVWFYVATRRHDADPFNDLPPRRRS